MQYRCSVDDKVAVFNVKGTNIMIVILMPHSATTEKIFVKPKKGVVYIT